MHRITVEAAGHQVRITDDEWDAVLDMCIDPLVASGLIDKPKGATAITFAPAVAGLIAEEISDSMPVEDMARNRAVVEAFKAQGLTVVRFR